MTTVCGNAENPWNCGIRVDGTKCFHPNWNDVFRSFIYPFYHEEVPETYLTSKAPRPSPSEPDAHLMIANNRSRSLMNALGLRLKFRVAGYVDWKDRAKAKFGYSNTANRRWRRADGGEDAQDADGNMVEEEVVGNRMYRRRIDRGRQWEYPSDEMLAKFKSKETKILKICEKERIFFPEVRKLYKSELAEMSMVDRRKMRCKFYKFWKDRYEGVFMPKRDKRMEKLHRVAAEEKHNHREWSNSQARMVHEYTNKNTMEYQGPVMRIGRPSRETVLYNDYVYDDDERNDDADDDDQDNDDSDDDNQDIDDIDDNPPPFDAWDIDDWANDPNLPSASTDNPGQQQDLPAGDEVQNVVDNDAADDLDGLGELDPDDLDDLDIDQMGIDENMEEMLEEMGQDMPSPPPASSSSSFVNGSSRRKVQKTGTLRNFIERRFSVLCKSLRRIHFPEGKGPSSPEVMKHLHQAMKYDSDVIQRLVRDDLRGHGIRFHMRSLFRNGTLFREFSMETRQGPLSVTVIDGAGDPPTGVSRRKTPYIFQGGNVVWASAPKMGDFREAKELCNHEISIRGAENSMSLLSSLLRFVLSYVLCRYQGIRVPLYCARFVGVAAPLGSIRSTHGKAIAMEKTLHVLGTILEDRRSVELATARWGERIAPILIVNLRPDQLFLQYGSK